MYELIPFGHRIQNVPAFDPFREVDNMFFRGKDSPMISAFSTDIVDKGDAFELNAELPGFAKEDISLSLDNDCLTIKAERKSEEKEEKTNFIRRERFYGSYVRSFDLTGIDSDNIEASYKDGVLSLTLPKVKEEIKEKRTIEIK